MMQWRWIADLPYQRDVVRFTVQPVASALPSGVLDPAGNPVGISAQARDFLKTCEANTATDRRLEEQVWQINPVEEYRVWLSGGRLPVQRAMQYAICRVLNDYIPLLAPDAFLVEGGPGIGFMTALLPQKLQQRLTLLERSVAAVGELRRMNQAGEIAVRDIVEGSVYDPPFPHIDGWVGLSQLDSINLLWEALPAIRAKMSVGARLIHFQDAQPQIEGPVMWTRKFPRDARTYRFLCDPGSDFLSGVERVARQISVPLDVKMLHRVLAAQGAAHYLAVHRGRQSISPRHDLHERLCITLEASGFRLLLQGTASALLKGDRRDVHKVGVNTFLSGKNGLKQTWTGGIANKVYEGVDLDVIVAEAI